jgi:hypothetical protein
MNRNGIKFNSYLAIFALAILLFVYAWDIYSASEEKWEHYNASAPNTIISEHTTFESCDKAMQQSQAQSGCRRVDGPYSLVNAIADFLL